MVYPEAFQRSRSEFHRALGAGAPVNAALLFFATMDSDIAPSLGSLKRRHRAQCWLLAALSSTRRHKEPNV